MPENGAHPEAMTETAPGSGPALSVVIPVKDEAECIGALVEEIAQTLTPRLSFEVVVVDDGSRDQTPAMLEEARGRYPWLRILRHRDACGQSTAILSGVRAARADWIVTLDGDGQNPPAEIVTLLDARDRDGDPPLTMVAGQRRKRRDNRIRRLSSRIANACRDRLLHDGVRDSGCSLKLFRREAFLSLPYFDHMHRFLPVLILRHGGRVALVDVDHRERLRGRSKYGFHDRLWSGIVDLLGVKWLQWRTRLPVIDRLD